MHSTNCHMHASPAPHSRRSIVSDPYGGIKRALFGLDGIWIAMVLWLGLTEAKEMYEATQVMGGGGDGENWDEERTG